MKSVNGNGKTEPIPQLSQIGGNSFCVDELGFVFSYPPKEQRIIASV
jgi:hypothetical protein